MRSWVTRPRTNAVHPTGWERHHGHTLLLLWVYMHMHAFVGAEASVAHSLSGRDHCLLLSHVDQPMLSCLHYWALRQDPWQIYFRGFRPRQYLVQSQAPWSLLQASSAHLGGISGHIEPDGQDFIELHLYPKGRQASWPPEPPHPTQPPEAAFMILGEEWKHGL